MAIIVVAAVAFSYAVGYGLTNLQKSFETGYPSWILKPRGLEYSMKPAAVSVTKTVTAATTYHTDYALQQAGRMIVRTADIEMESDDPGDAANRIAAIAESYGGYVAWMSVKSQNPPSASITVKVPEKSFFDALNEIRKVGKVLKEDVNARDVTEQYIDLDARLRNLRAEEAWLLNVVNKAKNVQDLIMIEKELWRVRGEIERIEAQLKNLQRIVEYSSITISIKSPHEPKPPPSPYPEFDLTPVLVVAVTALLYILYGLVFLLIVGVPLAAITFAVYLVYRRISKQIKK